MARERAEVQDNNTCGRCGCTPRDLMRGRKNEVVARVMTKRLLALARIMFVLMVLLTGVASQGQSQGWELRVCAEPNSLPYSNKQGRGSRTVSPRSSPRNSARGFLTSGCPNLTQEPVMYSSRRAAVI